jgi:hypothetical protein
VLMAGVLLWQFLSGNALGVWWHPRISRGDNPKTYWFVLALQCAILGAVLLTGKSWHVR